MPMIKCKECAAVVSDQAKQCPSCGISKPGKRARHGCLIAAGIGCAFIILSAVFTPARKPPAPDTPEQAAAKKAQFDREFAAAMGAITLRDMMRNPRSFELMSVTRVKDWYCYEYRAENGFGGLNVEHAASNGIRVWSNDEGSSLYQGHCSGKAGENLTGAVNAALIATVNK